MFDNIKFMGAGLGYRKELFTDRLGLKKTVDCIEVVSEHFLNGTPQSEMILEQLTDNYNVLLHGLNLSVCSPRIDMVYLMEIKRLVIQTKVPYYTDHLSITRGPGFNLGHLAPILYNKLSLERCIENVSRVQDVLGIPLALENITYGFNIAADGFSHGEFFSELVEKTNCGILLDLTNVFINAHNHNFDLKKYLDTLPLKNVIHMHLSGGHLDHNGKYVDSHSYSVPDEVWSLLDYVWPKTSVKSVILERDDEYDEPLDIILADILKCKTILDIAIPK